MSSACIPFLEHDDGNRVLMGANMMRQWLPPAEREPAFVRTGLEPRAPDFWCGRNLLTALVSWDGDAFEDAVLLSRSGARKLGCPEPLEAGDKLSNRHGIKGVVSRVAPDEEMPRLPDGTPVELVFSFSGIPSRWVMGLVREAALGHAARLRGEPAVVPPFEAPSDERLRDLLRGSGLRADGMTTLTLDGDPLRRPSTAGWVYWGCTLHRARPKVMAAVHPDDRGQGQRLGEMEVRAPGRGRRAGGDPGPDPTPAPPRRDDAGSLAERAAAGPVEPASTPSPAFAALAAGPGAGRNPRRCRPSGGRLPAGTTPGADAVPGRRRASPLAGGEDPVRGLRRRGGRRISRGRRRQRQARPSAGGWGSRASGKRRLSTIWPPLSRPLYDGLLPPRRGWGGMGMSSSAAAR